MKFLRQALATIAALAATTGLAPSACAAEYAAIADAPVLQAPPAQPSMYSFADVFRLTVAGAALADNPLLRLPTSAAALPDYQLRVASSEPREPARNLFSIAAPAPLPASYVFSIGALPQPQRWLLILSGLAAAAWVARRRLGYSF